MPRSWGIVTTVAGILVAISAGCGDGVTIDSPTDNVSETVGDTDSATSTATGTADAATDTTETPEFVLGTHPQGANDPSLFITVEEGDALEVQFGFQGLWMVLLAFKERGLLEGDLFLSAKLTVNGNEEGTLSLAEQKLAPAGDGFGYYYNFFLVVDDPSVAGNDGVITFTARDDVGGEVNLTRTVRLTGGE